MKEEDELYFYVRSVPMRNGNLGGGIISREKQDGS
ncbi:protein of unknown function [Kyrpidia spormannii]|uniref:Uncharacterized protein n=2 Tax=Kyrpidia spormannii TaxID=2055160 RepID=A0ACA8ZCF6_9BACL|nr:protein of unknown function [Kyrpidia spormannii]CAB3395537.1 protein of unknown function [Kyrpidia spormannii]